MEKGRLFTFGCSHTQYRWPSWANILGLGFKEFYNFGQPASGMFYMKYQFFYAKEHFKFHKNDTLLFMLSDEARIDYVKDKEWFNSGLAFNSKHLLGDKLFDHYTLTHAIESTYINLYYLKRELDEIGCNYEIMYAFPHLINEDDNFFDDNIKKICEKMYRLTNTDIKPLTDFGKKMESELGYKNYTFYRDKNKKIGNVVLDTHFEDAHFTVITHLEYVKKYLSKYYDDKNDDIVKKWHLDVPIDKHESEVIDKFYNLINKDKVVFINGVMDKIHLKK
jgi:hypothetical protein